MEFSAKVRTCLFLDQDPEQVAAFYTSLLPDSGIEMVNRPDPNGPALVAEFRLAGTPYMALYGNRQVQSTHTFSISVLTDDQAETDRLWEALLADGGTPGQCGWLQDRYGVHWQIVPKALPRLMSGQDPARAQRVQAAMMAMKKIDIQGLETAAASA